MAVSRASLEAPNARDAVRARVAFVLPRADWVECNASLIRRLAADPDVDVGLICANREAISEAFTSVQVSAYPFFEPDRGAGLARFAAVYKESRRKRQLIDQCFSSFRPDCIVVISTASREMLPWVRLARRRGIKVVQLQSVFLAPDLKSHVTGENRRLLHTRGVTGFVRLVVRCAVQEFAGLPAAVLKSSEHAGGADRVFAINAAQAAIFAEHVPQDRIEAVGVPLLDHLHERVREVPRTASAAAVRAQWNVPPKVPLAVYVSKSLEKFCHDDPRHEREFQRFAINAFLSRFPDAVLIVKLHPVEDARAFQDVAGHPRVRVVKDGDIHQIVHYADLVISLGTSTPAFYAVFHGRPRIIIREADGIRLDYQRELIDVSVGVRTRPELERILDDLRASRWPESLPPAFARCDGAARRFGGDLDGLSTPRVHQRFRAFLGLAAS